MLTSISIAGDAQPFSCGRTLVEFSSRRVWGRSSSMRGLSTCSEHIAGKGVLGKWEPRSNKISSEIICKLSVLLDIGLQECRKVQTGVVAVLVFFLYTFCVMRVVYVRWTVRLDCGSARQRIASSHEVPASEKSVRQRSAVAKKQEQLLSNAPHTCCARCKKREGAVRTERENLLNACITICIV